jgi:DNA-binding winged helix-turn-helix (wHTH) protein/TolB-like protein
MQLKSGYLYEFGPFVLDTSQCLLSREGIPVPITRKTYDLLLLFVESNGRLLPKDELKKSLWPDTSVDDSNLTQQISTARKVLGDTGGENRYIVTVPGRGYRFAAAVTVPANHVTKPQLRLRRAVILGSLIAVSLMVAAYAIRSRIAARPRSLAILPFQSLKVDTVNEFLGFSLADAIITKLGSVRSLTVRPSSAVEKYRHEAVDLRRAAADLQVDTLLTGNFLRDGNDLRITSQLIDVRTQNILWKGAFDIQFDRLLTVQDSVARQIVKGLQLSLSTREMESLRPENPIAPLAYEYYLRGVDLYSQGEFAMATKMLKKSAEIDPGYSLTWAHLGRALTANASFELGGREEYREAQAAYEKALSLHPAPIEASVYMANLFTDTGQPERAVPLLREALRTNPNHAEVHWELGYAYRFGGMLKESVQQCELARSLDPGVKLNSSALNAYLYLGQYDRFLQSLPKATDSVLILFYRAFAEYHQKRLDEAAMDFDRAFDLRPSLFQARIGKALSDGIRGQAQRGVEMLRETESKIAALGVGDPEAAYKIAQAYAVLGDKVAALRVLRVSTDGGFFPYPYLVTDPLLDCLRNEAEFKRLLAVTRQRHEAFQRKFF